MDILAPVYLVDDDDIDALSIRKAYESINPRRPLRIFNNDADFIKVLNGRGPAPFLVLLDIKMPGITGLQILQKIRAESKHRHLPVVMLTSSDDLHDISAARELGASGYFIKQHDFHEQVNLMRLIENYWTLNRMS